MGCWKDRRLRVLLEHVDELRTLEIGGVNAKLRISECVALSVSQVLIVLLVRVEGGKNIVIRSNLASRLFMMRFYCQLLHIAVFS